MNTFEAVVRAYRELGIRAVVTDTIMRGPAEKANLARVALRACDGRAAGVQQ